MEAEPTDLNGRACVEIFFFSRRVNGLIYCHVSEKKQLHNIHKSRP